MGNTNSSRKVIERFQGPRSAGQTCSGICPGNCGGPNNSNCQCCGCQDFCPQQNQVCCLDNNGQNPIAYRSAADAAAAGRYNCNAGVNCNAPAPPPPPPRINCMGVWQSAGGVQGCGGNAYIPQVYQVITPAQNGGGECPNNNGDTRNVQTSGAPCPTTCDAGWTDVSNQNIIQGCGANTVKVTQIYNIKTQGFPQPCQYQNGQQQTILTSQIPCPVTCQGQWNNVGGVQGCGPSAFQQQVYQVITPAQNGGGQCPYSDGQSRNLIVNAAACPVNCQGNWTDIPNTTIGCGPNATKQQQYSITTSAQNGGAECPNKTGDKQNVSTTGPTCPADCVGVWQDIPNSNSGCGIHATKTQRYTYTQQAVAGGAPCQISAGTTQSVFDPYGPTCIDCIGTWTNIPNTKQGCGNNATIVQQYNIIKQSSGGLPCAYNDGALQTTFDFNGALCPADCKGQWNDTSTVISCGPAAYKNQSYQIKSQKVGNGADCPFSSGDSQIVPINNAKQCNFNFIFTNGSATGQNGPSLANLLSTSTYSSANWASNSHYLKMPTQGIQAFTIPATGKYQIICGGASGATGGGSLGGRGIIISNIFNFNEGDIIQIAVGQIGTINTLSNTGGGGGGTFVIRADNQNPLLIAGGGGGNGNLVDNTFYIGTDAVLSKNGQSGNGNGGIGGSNGNGGGNNSVNTNSLINGGGGGGFYSNGVEKQGSNNTNGNGFVNVPTGGLNAVINSTAVITGGGGFGGGGGGFGTYIISNQSTIMNGGGGGGYSGGGGGGNGKGGGGGGSFDSNGSANLYTGSLYGYKNNTNGYNTGDGFMILTFIDNSQVNFTQATDCYVRYGAWGECSKQCGGGLQQRTFALEQPINGGKSCDGISVISSQTCNTQSCEGDVLPVPPSISPAPTPASTKVPPVITSATVPKKIAVKSKIIPMTNKIFGISNGLQLYQQNAAGQAKTIKINKSLLEHFGTDDKMNNYAIIVIIILIILLLLILFLY